MDFFQTLPALTGADVSRKNATRKVPTMLHFICVMFTVHREFDSIRKKNQRQQNQKQNPNYSEILKLVSQENHGLLLAARARRFLCHFMPNQTLFE